MTITTRCWVRDARWAVMLAVAAACGTSEPDGSQSAGASTGRSALEACHDYVDAYAGCVGQAIEGDPALIDELVASIEGTCDLYAEFGAAAVLVAQFDCFAEVFLDSDCSSPEELEAVALELSTSCAPE
jgi:hypothetical protein